jgi:hypothetical protein
LSAGCSCRSAAWLKIASKETGLKKLLLNLFRFGRLVAEPASLLR